MPYCPKCDMEFVEGITVCSDCGGPLVESEEAYKKMKKEEDAEKAASLENLRAAEASLEEETGKSAAPHEDPLAPMGKKSVVHPGVYIDAAQRYDDMKSSASAFYLVGAGFTVFSAVCWMGLISLPLLVRIVITVIGLGSLAVGFKTTQSAKKLAPEISAEKERTQSIIQWFTDTYTGKDLDSRISAEHSDLSEEERSLKRYELIQDYLVTNHDLPDPAYVDALAEEIYGKLFEA